MSLLRQLTTTLISQADTELNGKALTRPQLDYTDGTALTFVVDVDIGEKVALRNVPIARGNRSLVYAEAGAALRLRRTASGQYQVIGFSKEAPGTYMQVAVDIDTLAIGAPTDFSLTSRPLTLGELASYGGGFGVIALGSVAVFQGGFLIRIS